MILQTDLLIMQCHPLHIIIPYTATSAYQGSFFPQTIRDWNVLPTQLIEIENNDLFHSKLTDFLIT